MCVSISDILNNNMYTACLIVTSIVSACIFVEVFWTLLLVHLTEWLDKKVSDKVDPTVVVIMSDGQQVQGQFTSNDSDSKSNTVIMIPEQTGLEQIHVPMQQQQQQYTPQQQKQQE
jgi:hypothetical protein